MKKILIVFLSFLSNFAFSNTPDWSDEFQYIGLPDSSKWSYEEGFVRNNELQYYTSHDATDVFSDGNYLIIKANKREYANAMYREVPKNWKEERKLAKYTSASITTKGKFSFNSGVVEIRAKLPVGSGVWPAFWMLGSNIDKVGYPACGEIDMMEYFGRANKTITSNVHLKSLGRKVSFPGKVELSYLPNDFNIYKLVWRDGYIKFYINDQMYHQVAFKDIPDHPFENDFFILINFAVGGDPSGYVDESDYPKELIVDYVRYYKNID